MMSQWQTNLGSQIIDLSYLNSNSIHKVYKTGIGDPSQAKFYLFIGDLHGNIKAAILLAIRLQILFNVSLTAVFQVGDFGFWPSGIAAKDEDNFYKKDDSFDFFELQQAINTFNFFSVGQSKLETLKSHIYFIRGNHEDFEQLNLLPKNMLSEVIPGIYFVPDYFKEKIEGLNVIAVGGILTDLERGKGKKAKTEFKKTKTKLETDMRRSNSSFIIQSNSTETDLIITHSGLGSREKQDGSKKLETYLMQSNIPLHFYGHHHRYSIGKVGQNTLSIGLRNLDIDAEGIPRIGSFAILAWNDRKNFEIYSDCSIRG